MQKWAGLCTSFQERVRERRHDRSIFSGGSSLPAPSAAFRHVSFWTTSRVPPENRGRSGERRGRARWRELHPLPRLHFDRLAIGNKIHGTGPALPMSTHFDHVASGRKRDPELSPWTGASAARNEIAGGRVQHLDAFDGRRIGWGITASSDHPSVDSGVDARGRLDRRRRRACVPRPAGRVRLRGRARARSKHDEDAKRRRRHGDSHRHITGRPRPV